MSQRSTRRAFLSTAAAVGLGGWCGLLQPGTRRLYARSRQGLRVTEIERHVVRLPFNDFNAKELYHAQGPEIMTRTIFVLKTENGLEGYGESWGSSWPPQADIEKYIGTSPFDWIGDRLNLPINMACYDLMGKHLRVPTWKLVGPKVRSWVPVAAWTDPQPPDAMAEEVRQAARRGYNWLKFHVNETQDVVDQTEAMQKVAPPGFKIHYDFNANSNFEAVYPVIKELERFPIASRVEDPILAADHDGYRLLRRKSRLSILLHHAPPEVMMKNLCDGYMAGHASIGQAMHTAALAESTNTPFMLQHAGGAINLAFRAHEAAAFKMAALEHVNLSNLWKDDVTTENFSVVGGSVAVPKGPGLGVALDRAKLAKYKNVPKPKPPRLLARVKYESGLTVFFRHDLEKPSPQRRLRFISRVDVPGPVPGYRNHVVTDLWEDDSSAEFAKMWDTTQSGPHWVEK